mgnify:CR=1 FL=1
MLFRSPSFFEGTQYFRMLLRCFGERTEIIMVLKEQITEELDRGVLETLLSQIADGDRHAMEQLYRRTAKNAYSYALSVLKNPADAEDMLHDCYLQVFRKAQSYRREGKPMAWIITIVKNLCRDALRKRKKVDPLTETNWRNTVSAIFPRPPEIGGGGKIADASKERGYA